MISNLYFLFFGVSCKWVCVCVVLGLCAYVCLFLISLFVLCTDAQYITSRVDTTLQKRGQD